MANRWTCWLHVTLMAAVVCVCVTPSLSAQQRKRPRIRILLPGTSPDRTAHRAVSILIEPSPSIANLFARAEEGIARADWKFAIDCLQRIIDDPQGSLFARPDGAIEGGALYESARRQAMRRLASLPPEGLGTYRLLYDGKAMRLYEQAKAAHDPKALRVVVDRYLLSRYGDDAADLLASWALDAGRAGETVTVLTDLVELVPDRSVPEPLIVAKLAAAYALLGRTEEAASVVETYAETGDGELQIANSVLTLRPWKLDSTDSMTFWQMVGGSPARRGAMPAVEPTLVQPVPWRFDLPGATADTWRHMFSDDPTEPPRLPVRQLVTDGHSVFLRTPQGCSALDIEDLAVRWESKDESPIFDVPAGQFTGQGTRSRGSAAPSSKVDTAFKDYVAGALSLCDGLVMTISRRGTVLIAYDANTGGIRWQRGRSGDPDDPLGDVEFRSVPIAVGDTLWVPFLRQADLHVALLDPEDGSLIRTVLLGSASRLTGPRHALQPASADGIVYVPSGHDVLFAVDAGKHTIRWASRYGPPPEDDLSGQSEEGVESLAHTGWPYTPPVVTGGLVLLAPRERGELLAFSAANGEFRWSAQCGNCSYMIAADHDHVWLGGRSVSCMSLTDGGPVWSAGVASVPTGRAVLSGGLIYVPTLDGLLSLDAASGETLGQPSLPGSQSPLGDLLCLGSAMFTVNASCVRKFPDIGQSYPATLARHEADPSDVVASIRLAWLELWRGEPQRAYEVLEDSGYGLQTSGCSQEPVARSRNLAHVRVETLLALAAWHCSRAVAQTSGTGVDVLALLERASHTARTALDRLRCELAIADRLSAVGRAAEAYRRLWRLGCSSDADQVVSFEDHVEGAARIDIARRLRQIEPHLTDEQRIQLGDYTAAQVDMAAKRLHNPAHTREDQEHLRAICHLQTPGAVGQRALLELASYKTRRLHYEQAEQLLRESVRLDSQPTLTITALMQLCQLYLDSTPADLWHRFETGAPASIGPLAHALEELESRFGSATIPDTARDPRWLAPGAAGEGVPRVGGLVADWVQEVRSNIAAAEQGAHQRVGPTSPVGPTFQSVGGTAGKPAPYRPVQLTGEKVWTLEWGSQSDAPRIVSFGEQLRPIAGGPAECVVLHGPGDVAYCYDVSDGKLLWKAVLCLPETFPDEIATKWYGDENIPRRAVADGQTAVFSGRDGLFAVGLVTGRRIWFRPYEPANEPYASSFRDMTMAANDGLLAAMPKAGRLTLMRMLDGSSIWERDLRGERVQRVWMLENRVLTADPLLERVHVFDRADGSLVKRRLFSQPDARRRLVELVRTGNILCGPVSGAGHEGVVAMDVDSGEVAWRMKLDRPLAQLFKLQEGYIGIGLLGGNVRIVDAATGDLVLGRRISGAHAAMGAALIDGTLIVHHLSIRDENPYSALTAIDVATGEQQWRRDDLIPFARIDESLRVVGGRLPAVVRLGGMSAFEADMARREKRQEVHLTMVDIRTGLTAGAEVKLPAARGPAQLNGDFEVFPTTGVAVVGTADAIHALETESPTDQTQEGL